MNIDCFIFYLNIWRINNDLKDKSDKMFEIINK